MSEQQSGISLTSTTSDDIDAKNKQMRAQAIEVFSQDDSVMNINILPTLKVFLTAKGTPTKFVELVQEHYRGFAEMTNLVCDWMIKAGFATDTEVSEMVVLTLKELVLEHFDPEKADSIFSTLTSAPVWLDAMIESPLWRNLLYELVGKHRKCTLLDFSIQKISDSGYQSEIAALPTASSYFGIFNSILVDEILRTPDLQDNGNNSDESRDHHNPLIARPSTASLVDMVVSSQHAYLYVRSLLASMYLEESKKGAAGLDNLYAIERIQSALRVVATSKTNVSSVRRIDLLTTPTTMPHNESSHPVLSMINAGSTNPADITKLHSLYSTSPPGSSPPPHPVIYLHTPDFLPLLIRDLFNLSKTISANHTEKYLWILAYAVSVGDDRSVQSTEAAGEEFKSTFEALKRAYSICVKPRYGDELSSQFGEIESIAKIPVVTLCLLEYIESNYSLKEYYVKSYTISSHTPPHILVLLYLIHSQPTLSVQIFESLTRCLSRTLEIATSYEVVPSCKDLFTCMASFVRLSGGWTMIYEFLSTWSASSSNSSRYGADFHKLVLHAITEVISLISPPFSLDFAVSIVSLVDSIRSHIRAHANGPQTVALRKLMNAIGQSNDLTSADPSIAQKTTQILKLL